MTDCLVALYCVVALFIVVAETQEPDLNLGQVMLCALLWPITLLVHLGGWWS